MSRVYEPDGQVALEVIREGTVILEHSGVTPVRLDADAEQLLVERLRRGDRAALEEVARTHGPRLLRLAHRLLGWSGDAEDAVQEVLAKLMARPDRIGGDRGLEAWLVTVTVNRCRDRRRVSRAFQGFLGRYRGRSIRGESTDAELSRSETHERVRAIVRGLRPRDREVIVLRYLEGMSVAEIGRTLGVAPDTVEVRLHRARRRLRERLEGLQ